MKQFYQFIGGLLIGALFVLIIFGGYQYGCMLSNSIKHGKKLDSLQIEKLKLEIEIKKLQLLTPMAGQAG